MSRKPRLPAEPICIEIESMTHDGRGVARVEGKTVFVDGALPGETVDAVYTATHRNYDEAKTEHVVDASRMRVEPGCAHFGLCGGCSLQHVAPRAQIEAKQNVLLDNLAHFGRVEPERILEPLTAPYWGYRRKARLGVKYVAKKGRVLVGFREKRGRFLADLERCEILDPSVGHRLLPLSELIGSLEAYNKIPQIEVAVADNATALVLRNLTPLSSRDLERIRDFAQQHDFWIYLQPKGPETAALFWPESGTLSYRIPEYDVELTFEPTQFTQINAAINEKMVSHAMGLLEVEPSDKVLDLFCGLGNFTLPIARKAAHVTGVEGEASLIETARKNARRNGIENVDFHVTDLAKELEQAPWMEYRYDKVLLDPPRTGALEAVKRIGELGVRRIVYVSCNPATLARDANILVNSFGYTLRSVGVMDMFPHTAHVESIALFEA